MKEVLLSYNSRESGESIMVGETQQQVAGKSYLQLQILTKEWTRMQQDCRRSNSKPVQSMFFFQQGSFSKDSTKSTTEWGPSFQVHRPTGDISHSDHHTVLKIRLLLQGVNTGHGWQWLSQCWCLWDIIFVLFLIQESHVAQASLEVTM